MKKHESYTYDLSILIDFINEIKKAGIIIPKEILISLKIPIPARWINPDFIHLIPEIESILVDAGLIATNNTSLLGNFQGKSYDRIPFYGDLNVLVYIMTEVLVKNLEVFKNSGSFLYDIQDRFMDGNTGEMLNYDSIKQARNVIRESSKQGTTTYEEKYSDVIVQILSLG